MAWATIADLVLNQSQALSVVALGFYIAYETRLGAIKEVRENHRTLGVALYKVIERDDKLDENAFRESLWGEDDDEVLLSDLNRGD